jgi:branched-chain amino acid transport system substrate-binding protein
MDHSLMAESRRTGSAWGAVIVAVVLGVSLHGRALADIRVGAPFALSGSVAALAQDMRQGAELAMAQVNQQGGILGQPYRLEFVDTACDPNKAVQAVTQWAQDPAIVALVGPVCSGETLRQASSVSIPAGMVTLSVASASSLITALQDKDLVFRTAPSDDAKGLAMAKVTVEMGIKEIAVSHASDAYNTGVAKVFATAFRQLGGKVTVTQVHQPGKPDYSGEAGAVTAGSSALALFAYYGSGGVQYLREVLKGSGMRHVVGTDGLMSPELATALEAAQLARVTIVSAAADKEREGYRRWRTFAEAHKLKADGPYVANAYDAAFMMALAIEAAGSADRSKVSAGLRAISGPSGQRIFPGEFDKARKLLKQGTRINYDGASGPVDFDEAGDISGFFSVSRFASGIWTATLVK